MFRREGVQCRHSHFRRSSRKCPRASLLHPLHSRYTTNREGVQPQRSLLHQRRSAVFPRKGGAILICGGELFCIYRRDREMDGIEPAKAESLQNPVHLDGYVAAACQGEFQFSCSWLIHQCQSTVNNLGVTIDCQLTMKDHVRRTCTACFYQLRQLRVVRRSLSSDACTSLVHAFISSRLDYCNSLLAGISDTLIRQLQSVLSVAARFVTRRRKYDPISEIIRDKLHWLPVRQRIDFKLGVLIYKCLHNLAPPYLMEMVPVSHISGRRMFRASAHGDVIVPRTESSWLGSRGWVLEVARALDSHSGTVFQLA